MSELLKLAEELFLRGSYAEALSTIKQIQPVARSAFADCLLCECLQFTGDHKASFHGASTGTEAESTHPVLKARYFGVIGRVRIAENRREDATDALARGIRLLERTDQYRVLADLQQLWLTSVAGLNGSSLTAVVRTAYRTAIRSQDPIALGGFHVRMGQLEGQRGAFATAIHHLELAESLLDRCQHFALRGSLYVNRACVFGLTGEFEQGRKAAETAFLHAQRSGYSRLSMVASTCAAHCAVAMGELTVAESWLRRGMAIMKRLDVIERSLFDNLAGVELLKGNFDAAIAHLSASRDFGQDPKWSPAAEPYHLLTELELHKRRRDHQGRQKALEVLERIRDAQGDQNLRLLISLAKAENAFDEGADTIGQQLIVEQLAEFPKGVIYRSAVDRIVSRALWAAGDSQAASRRLLRSATASYLRGTRVAWTEALSEYLSTGSSDGCAAAYSIDAQVSQARSRFGCFTPDPKSGWYARHSSNKVSSSRERLQGFDDAVAILESTGAPELRGREALASTLALGLAKRAALIRKTAAGTRVLVAANWSADAVAEALRKPDALTRLLVGKELGATVELIVAPNPDVRSRLALDGVRVMLEVALAAESRQADHQRLDALWQPEVLAEEPGAVFTSPQTIELIQSARKVAATSLPVLLLGDTGTGKEVLAHAIHRASARAAKIFLPFNCSAVPRDMVESQLFGYRRGSFTGAAVDFAGVIRSAEGGTLFLDEIGELSLDIQPKLLRFLETGEVHPLGEGRPIKVDVRVIAATNADLEDLIQRKLFREDLYYRLNIALFQMPRLAERREEIPQLALHLLRRFEADEKKHGIEISDEVMEYLLLYEWPGNIRQLSNELRRMVAMVGHGETLTADHLSPAIRASRRTIPVASEGEGATAPAHAASASDLTINLDQPMPHAVEALERAMIEHAVARAGGKVEEAARLLGISRKGLFLKRRRWQKSG